MERKNVIASEYLPYRFADLEAEYKSQELKAVNLGISPAVRADANVRLEVIDEIKQLFLIGAQAGLDVTSMTVQEVICAVTGKTPAQLSATGISSAYQTIDGAVGKVVDVTVDGIRDGANWLGRKLLQWTERK